MKKYDENDIRVWNAVNCGSGEMHFYCGFASPEEANKFIDIVANEQLTDDTVGSNAFGIDIFIDGDWEDYDDWNDE